MFQVHYKLTEHENIKCCFKNKYCTTNLPEVDSKHIMITNNLLYSNLNKK